MYNGNLVLIDEKRCSLPSLGSADDVTGIELPELTDLDEFKHVEAKVQTWNDLFYNTVLRADRLEEVFGRA